MPLLKNRAVVTSDSWTFVKDEEPVPASGDVVLSASRFLREHAALHSRSGRLGALLEPTDDVYELGPHAGQLALVAVNFPKFGDGRGYSHARLLRERYAFTGEVRAIGEVLADQLFYMQRVGFDAFQLVDGKDVNAAIRAFEDFSVTYQADAHEKRPLFRRIARG
jgi:uncharacterized protein (DUF934 family)